jgi:hypothetical protein
LTSATPLLILDAQKFFTDMPRRVLLGNPATTGR